MGELKEYITVRGEAEDSFIEKKSEFIGYISPAATEEEANAFIASIRKKHPDATHNVFAYILQGTGIARCSDDGEPSGTAGMPVLEVIKREGVTGVCVVVTRYFGGILLGAGGLVRAYAKAAKMALDKAGVCRFVPFTEFTVECDYGAYEKLRHDARLRSILWDGADFYEKVVIRLACRREDTEEYTEHIRNATGGKAKILLGNERFDAAPL